VLHHTLELKIKRFLLSACATPTAEK